MLFLCGVWFLLGHLCRVSRRPEATFCKGSRIMRAPLTYKYPDSSFFQLFMHTNCIYTSTFIHGFYRSVNPWDPRDLCSRCVNAPALFSTTAMSLVRNVPSRPSGHVRLLPLTPHPVHRSPFCCLHLGSISERFPARLQ